MRTLRPHEIADLRTFADESSWLDGQQLHALLDAYERVPELEDEIFELKQKIEDLEEDRATRI